MPGVGWIRRYDMAEAMERSTGLDVAGSVVRRGDLVVLPSQSAQDLIEAFWPGGLTLVCAVQPTLQWDLGETGGTVAVRMPLHPVAIELLTATGPMAVSSANRSGLAPATTVDEAIEQLGDDVSVYLDGGPSGAPVPSSIVDVTGDVPRLLRAGAVTEELLREVCGDLVTEP
jgi:L-threonylcarbamoyladenylate synthase